MKRKEAKQLGLKRYLNDKPCPKGHSGERYVSTGMCTICLLEYKRSWEKENKDKVRAYSKEYYSDNKKCCLKRFKEWVRNNPEKMKALNKKWHQNNPEGRRLHENKRRANKKKSNGDFTKLDINFLKKQQNNACVYCAVDITKTFHVDHKTPLSKGGDNNIENIQILCPTCNLRKHNKDHLTYLKTLKGD